MISISLKKTAKSARRIIALALLGVFATAGVVVYAAAAKPDWTIAPTPTTATVTKGQNAQIAIQLTRTNGFTGSVALSLGQLPAGVGASWDPSSTIPATSVSTQTNSVQLRLTTTASTPTGNHTIFVVGKNGNTTKYTAVTLSVQQAEAPNFAVEVSPPIQFIAQNDDAQYLVKVVRSNGHSGPIALSTYNLPDKVAAGFTAVQGKVDEYTLDLHSDHNAPQGSYSFAVTGNGSVGDQSVTRFGAIALNVETTKAINISGDLGQKLVPGGSGQTIDPLLYNPHKFAVRLSSLSVAVHDATSSRGCSGGDNFLLSQMQDDRFRPNANVPAIMVPSQTPIRLSAISGIAASDLPKITMRNLAGNQDACKNTQIRLEYVGSVRK